MPKSKRSKNSKKRANKRKQTITKARESQIRKVKDFFTRKQLKKAGIHGYEEE
jgi:hypothetical protein